MLVLKTPKKGPIFQVPAWCAKGPGFHPQLYHKTKQNPPCSFFHCPKPTSNRRILGCGL